MQREHGTSKDVGHGHGTFTGTRESKVHMPPQPSPQSGRNITAMRGAARASFGTECWKVRWHVPPMTSRSPEPNENASERPPPLGRNKNRRGAPSESVATVAVSMFRAT